MPSERRAMLMSIVTFESLFTFNLVIIAIAELIIKILEYKKK